MPPVLQQVDLTPGQQMPDPDSIIHAEPIMRDPATLRIFYFTEEAGGDQPQGT